MLHNLSILIGLSLLLTLSVSKYHTLFKIWISVKALHNTDMLYVQICTFFVSNNFLKNNCSDPRRGSCNSEVSILHHFQIDSYKADNFSYVWCYNCKKKRWLNKQRIIKCFVKENRKIPKNMNISWTIYSIYSPKTILIKPTRSIQIDTGITVPLLDEIRVTVIILPTDLNHILKHRSNSQLTKYTGHLVLYFQSPAFSKKFAFNKNVFFDSLVVRNEKLNEKLAI